MKASVYIPILLWAVLFGWPTRVMPQEVQYNFHHLTPAEGLSNENVNAVVQDHYGYIWLGTNFGLNRFDGTSLKTFYARPDDSTALYDNAILSLCSDRYGRLWVGSAKGLQVYRTRQENFTRYTPSLPVYKIVADPSGRIWVATEKGLRYADDATRQLQAVSAADTLLNALLHMSITDLLCSPDGKLFLAGPFGILKLDLKTFSYQRIQPQAPPGNLIGDQQVEAIALDHHQNLWVATGYIFSMLYKIDPDLKSSVAYPRFRQENGKAIPNHIVHLLADAEGRIWVSTTLQGLCRYDPVTDSFQSYLHDPLQSGSLANNQCNGGLYKDREGVIWVPVSGYGVDYFHPDRVIFSAITPKPFTTPALIHSWGRQVAEDDQQNLWLATGGGVSVFHRPSGVIRNFENTLDHTSMLHSPSVRSLLNDGHGHMWIGTSKGLNQYTFRTGKMKFYNMDQGMPLMFVHCLFQSSRGTLLAGGNAGLYEYDAATDHFVHLRSIPALKEIAQKVIVTLKEDPSGLWWIGTQGDGVFVFDPVSSTVRHAFRTQDGLSDNGIRSLLPEENGNVWIGTRNGLNHYLAASDTFIVYRTEQGLPNTWIGGIQLDSSGRLWVGTGNGMCVIGKEGKILHQFGLADGLVSAQFNDQDAYKTKDGLLIFPCRKGFVVVNPNDLTWTDDQPEVYITSLRILDRADNGITGIEDLSAFRLAPHENFFNLDMRALNFLHPDQSWYAYKLEGFDPQWTYTKDPDAKYTNVSGGHYIFRYKASNNPYDWNVPEKQFHITLTIPVWKRWWFIALAAAALAVSAMTYMRWRIRSAKNLSLLKEKTQSLEKEKAMVMYENLKQHLNPHFLFNSLTSLNSLIHEDQTQASAFLDSLSKTYRYILRSRDTEMVPLRDELAFAGLYTRLQKTRFEKGFEVMVDVPEDDQYKKIVPVTLQNLIENAIKHNTLDEENPLIIRIYTADEYLIVQNNLQRKSFVETSNKQGLSNLTSLYQYLSHRPVYISETQDLFIVKIPLL